MSGESHYALDSAVFAAAEAALDESSQLDWERTALHAALEAAAPLIAANALSDAADQLPDAEIRTIFWLTGLANTARTVRNPA